VLEKYYGKTNQSYIICILLDPRFKLEYYEFDTSDKAEDPKKVKKNFMDVFEKYKAKVHGASAVQKPEDDTALDRIFKHQAKRPRTMDEVTLYFDEALEGFFFFLIF
jgi:hypothetical protein